MGLAMTSDVESIARLCHETNRAWCAFNGDASQVGWEQAEQWQRDSAVMGVRYLVANPFAGDSALHDNWSADKLADGWVYGPVKDPVAKTHHCLVPFTDLPPEQQFKDKLFRTIVLTAMGYNL